MSLGTLGKYELLEKIAEGGMGELFRARSTGPGDFERIVAVKRIRASMLQEERARQMFIDEAKITSFASHKNLVHLYDFGGEGDSLYLVMELVEGRDLGKILARCRQNRDPLRIPFAVFIAAQVAEGLDYLHRLAQGGQPLEVVHRDVSPQNVLVSFDGAVKLTDFGIALMRRGEPVTQAGMLKGKMGYMTPEQLSETKLDGRADIFCLGIVLWEMLTGGRLFQGVSDANVLDQVLHKRIPMPSTLNADVPPALDRVVMRALERNRAQRFNRAAEMAAALNALEGTIATDLELGQEIRRYFPDERTVLPSAAPAEPRTESMSTSLARFAPVVAKAQVDASPGLPPEPPPSTAVGQAARTEGSFPFARWRLPAVALLAIATLGAFSLFWFRPARPAALQPTATPKDVPTPQAGVGAETPTPAAAEMDAGGALLAVAAPDAVAPVANDAIPALPKPSAAVARPKRVPKDREPAVVRASEVHPWAEVVVDGANLGYTAGSWKVAPGHHHLLLRNGMAGIEREFDLEFPPGGELLIRGSLRALQPEFVR